MIVCIAHDRKYYCEAGCFKCMAEEAWRLKAENAALKADISRKDQTLLWLIIPEGPLYGVDDVVLDRIETALSKDNSDWLQAQLSQAKAEVYEKVGNDIKVGLQKVDLTRSEALLVEIMANEYLLRAAQMRGNGALTNNRKKTKLCQ